MRSSLFAMVLTGLAVASPLEDQTVDKRALGCLPVGPAVTDNFDDRAVLPTAPEVGALLAPTPNGTYINYTQTTYVNYGPLTNVNVPSKPNGIYLSDGFNNGTLIPAFNRANAFQLSSLRYVCLTRSAETAAVLPATCTFTVSCNVWGLYGPATTKVSKSFTYSANLLSFPINYDTAIFPVTFSGLSECFISVVDASPLGIGILPPPIAKPLTILALDDVANRGQSCFL